MLTQLSEKQARARTGVVVVVVMAWSKSFYGLIDSGNDQTLKAAREGICL